MICPRCGHDNPLPAKFCSHCGVRLPEVASGPEPSAPPRTAKPEPPAAAAWGRLEAGQVLDGRYEIVRMLGEGPRGVVYLARDLDLQGKEIAIKVFRQEITADPELNQALTDAVVSGQELTHPGVVKVYDLRRQGERRFVTEEYVPGTSLDRLLAQRPERRMSLPEACRVGIGILDVLVYAHPRAPHLGLSPGNVMVLGEFPEIRVKLTDFVVSGKLAGLEIEAGEGGHWYRAPEQLARGGATGIGPAADIYSTGAILYELLTGRPPAALAQPPSQVVDGLTPGLDQVLARALDPDPAGRFADVAHFRRDLVAVAKEAVEAELNQRRRAGEDQARIAKLEAEVAKALAEDRLDEAGRLFQALAESRPDTARQGLARIASLQAEREESRRQQELAAKEAREAQRRARRRGLAKAGRRLGLAAAAVVLVAAGVVGYFIWDDYTTRKDVEQWTAQARAARQKGQYRLALGFYRRLAEVRTQDDDLRRRIKTAQAHIKRRAAKAAPFIARAKQARGQKKLGPARDQVDQALKVDPHNPEARRLQAALTADRKKVKTWLAAAETAWAQKKFEAAGRLYGQVVALSAEHPIAAQRLARIAALVKARRAKMDKMAARAAKIWRDKNLPQAEKSYRVLLQAQPDNKAAQAALARIERQRRQVALLMASAETLWQARQFVAARALYLEVQALDATQALAQKRVRQAEVDQAALDKKIAVALAAGRRFMAARKWSEAKKSLGRVLQLDPANTEARQALKVVQARINEIAAAEAQAKTALAGSDLGQVAAALKRLQKLAPSHPAAARLKKAWQAGIQSLLKRARQALGQGRVDPAQKMTDQVLKLSPGHGPATALRAEIKAVGAKVAGLLKQIEATQKKKDWRRAGELIKQAAALDAKNPGLDKLAQINRAALAKLNPILDSARQAETRGDLTAARRDLQRAAALAPGDEQIAVAVKKLAGRIERQKTDGIKTAARLIKAEKWAEAEKSCQAVLVLDPKAAAAYAYRGTARLEQGKFLAALADFDQAIGLGLPSARLAGVQYERCFVLFRLARHQEAARACTRAINLAPDRAAYYRARAVIYRRLKMNRAADKDMARYKKLSRGR
jgi:tetratricopeptide (TPR) repeat protein